MVHQTVKPGSDTAYFNTGGPAAVQDLIATQDTARAAQPVAMQAKSWAPWIVGGLALAGVVWWLKRD